jgi:hypothetical protein
VTVVLEELEVGIEVNLLRYLSALRAGTHAIVKVVPDVRTGEVDRFLIGVRCGREITRVGC